jgi:hypothetical protein
VLVVIDIKKSEKCPVLWSFFPGFLEIFLQISLLKE